jgi:paraquat-inducible protein A
MQPLADERRALHEDFPRHLGVPALLVLSCVALSVGLSLPLITIEKMWFWSNEYSVFSGIVGLFRDGQYLLSGVLLVFSILFPTLKLAVLWVLWSFRMSPNRRRAWLERLATLGKWSMLDVFVVAILVVAAKLDVIADVQPRAGVYVFGLAVLLSMFTTALVERLARASLVQPPPPREPRAHLEAPRSSPKLPERRAAPSAGRATPTTRRVHDDEAGTH